MPTSSFVVRNDVFAIKLYFMQAYLSSSSPVAPVSDWPSCARENEYRHVDLLQNTFPAVPSYFKNGESAFSSPVALIANPLTKSQALHTILLHTNRQQATTNHARKPNSWKPLTTGYSTADMASDVIFSGTANPRKPPSFINHSRLGEHVSIIVSITRESITASNSRINGNVPSYTRRANRMRQYKTGRLIIPLILWGGVGVGEEYNKTTCQILTWDR
jgi:hypothetical protein